MLGPPYSGKVHYRPIADLTGTSLHRARHSLHRSTKVPRYSLGCRGVWSGVAVARFLGAFFFTVTAHCALAAGQAAADFEQKTTANPSRPSKQTISLVVTTAMKYQIDPAVVLALIDVESSFQASAVSPMGARGLMQLMPTTAFRYGLRRSNDLHDPATNIEIGTRHLRDLLLSSNGNLTLALASYNAGQGAIRRSGNTIPAYRETMLYVPAILGRIPVFQDLLRLNP